jgi:hypothetical protein
MSCHIQTAIDMGNGKQDRQPPPRLTSTPPAITLVRVPMHQPEKEPNDKPIKKNERETKRSPGLLRVVVLWPSKRNKSIVDSILEMTAHMAELQRNASTDLAIEVAHG